MTSLPPKPSDTQKPRKPTRDAEGSISVFGQKRTGIEATKAKMPNQRSGSLSSRLIKELKALKNEVPGTPGDGPWSGVNSSAKKSVLRPAYSRRPQIK